MNKEKIAASIAPHVSEPVLACAAAQSGGALRGLDRAGAGAGAGLLGMFASRAVAGKARERSKDQSNRFPADVVLALTESELLVFKGGNRDPGGPLARFPRASVEIKPGKILLPVTIGVADGIVQFRAIKRVGGDDLYAQLNGS